jgi:hypothetical protein
VTPIAKLASGGVLLTVAAALVISPALFRATRLRAPRSSTTADLGEARLARITQLLTGGPIGVRRSQLSLKYPGTMLEDETPIITATYQAFTRLVCPPSEPCIDAIGQALEEDSVKQLDVNITLTLLSSGFDVAPQQAVSARPGSPMPLVTKWAITPKGSGRRVMLLKLEEQRTRRRSPQHWGG